MLEGYMKAVSGTAGEALEIRAYRQLVETYSESTANELIQTQLRDAGETLDGFRTYLRIKTKIQNDEISIVRARREAEEKAKDCLRGLILDI